MATIWRVLRFPVPVEGLGARVEEDESGGVHRRPGAVEHLGEERPPEPVGGDGVEAAVLDEHRHGGHRVDGLLHART